MTLRRFTGGLIAAAAIAAATGWPGASARAQLLSAPIAPRVANSDTFVGCDGYGAPTEQGDGMIHYAMSLGIFNFPGEGNTLRQDAASGATGVADCDAALAALPPQHWRRKVSLLIAKAVHQLEQRDARDALVDLDSAQAAVKDPGDIFYARSLGLNLDVIRAYALREAGEADQASALAMKTLEARPWRRRAPLATVAALGPSADDKTVGALLRQGAALDPRELDRLFQWDFFKANFAEAALVYPSLVTPRFPEPSQAMGAAEREQWLRVAAATFWSVRDSQNAYALAALGRADEARAAMTAARDRLEAVTQNPPDPGSGKGAASRMAEINANNKARALAEPLLKRYETLVAARLMVDAGHAPEALDAVRPLQNDWVRGDVMRAALAAMHPRTVQAVPSPPPVIQPVAPPVVAAPISPANDTTITGLWRNNLPEAEAAERLPPGDGLGGVISAAWTGAAGRIYRDGPAPEPGAISIKTRPQRGPTLDMVGEIVLLRAAELAREQGKKGMIILHRDDVRHILNTYQYGRRLRTDPTGFETSIDVLFVDPAAVPPAYARTPWRVLDADAIHAALAPIYHKTAS